MGENKEQTGQRDKATRLADALRANLRRRKAQARDRRNAAEPAEDPPEEA